MGEFLLRMWNWLGETANRHPVMVISAVVMAIATVVLAIAAVWGNLINRRVPPTTPPPGGVVSMSVEEFQTELEKRGREVEERLAQLHGEERVQLENQLAEVNRQLFDIESAYRNALAKIREQESVFVGFGDRRAAQILAAMAGGNFSKADALLANLQEHVEPAVTQAAEVAYQRGIIATLQIKWDEAANHFDKAARLAPTYDRLLMAGEFAGRVARYKIGRTHFEKLLGLSRQEYGENSSQTAVALNGLAVLFRTTGQYHEAEPLLRQVLEIRREIFGEEHRDYVAGLNSLANVLRNAR